MRNSFQGLWRYLAIAALLLAGAGAARAQSIARPEFERLWARTAIPIQRDVANYSWVWGPEPFTPLLMEAFGPGQDSRRAVQYFDKARMEINNPAADPNAPWYITNGLLVNELIQGKVQVGLDRFIPLGEANISIAGDPGNNFPTYASLARLYKAPVGRTIGEHVTGIFLREGAGELPGYADDPATEILRVERGFGIPRAFWDFMNGRGVVYENDQLVRNQPIFEWLYVLGYPTTDAFWTRVRVGGVERDVMFQAFERRLLTYTPANPQPFQVEMGNVGRHYYQWRYEQPFAGGAQALVSVPTPGATVTPPLLVQGFGSGSAFEGAITVRLKNKQSGAVLASVNTQVMQADTGKAGPFEATLIFTPPAQPAPATIEIVTRSPRDGSEILLASQAVTVTHDGPPQALTEQIERVRQDLSKRLKIDADVIRVTSVEPTEWGGSLGCPAPERVYTLAIMPGYRLTLEAQGQRYVYHADRTDQFVLCRDGRPVLGLVSTAGELIAALRDRGYTVEEAGVVRQPFLRVDGTTYRISGGSLAHPAEVQVYGYADVDTAAQDAAGIGPDGQPEGVIVDRIALPYYYRSWQVLAILGGGDQAAAKMLSELLGPPFAAPNTPPAPARISWDEAKALILGGQVRAVAQSHSLEVALTLKDGRQLITTEPEIDAIFRVIEECGEKCADISVATE
jgi:hypothetical protein